MDSTKLYRLDVLRNKVPTLHPRYQWMKLELEPDDRIVLTSINGHGTVGHIIELTDLPGDSVARVMLKLVGRGVVLWDDTLPFYDEEQLLEVVPLFDPQNVNRNAHLDDTDRMLLTLINGKTSVRQMEAALPLSRERLLASVIRLKLADVISLVEAPPPPPPRETAPPRPRNEGTASHPSAEPAAMAAARPLHTPQQGVPMRPAANPMPTTGMAPEAPSAGNGATRPEPGTDRSIRSSRQDAFEEVTRRLLEGKSLDLEMGPDDTPVPVPRKSGTGGREAESRQAPRTTRNLEKKKRTEEARPKRQTREATAAQQRAIGSSLVPKMVIGAILAVLLFFGILSMMRTSARVEKRGGHNTVESFAGVIDLVQILPRQSGTFRAQIAPSWYDLSSSAKKSSVHAMAKELEPDSVSAIVLMDEDGKIVAEWEAGSITLFQ